MNPPNPSPMLDLPPPPPFFFELFCLGEPARSRRPLIALACHAFFSPRPSDLSEALALLPRKDPPAKTLGALLALACSAPDELQDVFLERAQALIDAGASLSEQFPWLEENHSPPDHSRLIRITCSGFATAREDPLELGVTLVRPDLVALLLRAGAAPRQTPFAPLLLQTAILRAAPYTEEHTKRSTLVALALIRSSPEAPLAACLRWAARAGSIPVALALIELGEDPTATEPGFPRSAMDIALAHKRVKCAGPMRAAFERRTLLEQASPAPRARPRLSL